MDQTDKYLADLSEELKKLDRKKINHLKSIIQLLIGSKKTLFICGNGGSAATASHMTCDLGKTILGKNPRFNQNRLRIICFNDNISLITAWGNDEGYDYIFSEQLKTLGTKGDCLIVITGSGNSKNIIEVVKEAKKIGVTTFGLLGFAGGKVKKLLDEHILVKCDDYGIIEDVHSILNHLITDYFKKI